MKKILDRLLAITLVGLCVVLPIGAFVYSLVTNHAGDCSVGDDMCVDKVVPELRTVRDTELAKIDEQIATWTKTRKETETRYNERIETMKGKRTAARSAELLKEGKREDVSSALLTWKSKLIPQALADTTTEPVAMTNTTETQSESEAFKQIQLFLAKKNAPYKDVDFARIARQTGVTDDEAVLLIAITGHESSFGNAFARTEGKRVIAASTEEGRSYHNYAGVKWCVAVEDCPTPTPIPDSRGFWLQKYPDDETFFITFFAQMKTGYFDKGCSTAGCIKSWYVGGNLLKKIAWANAVNRFVDDINATKVY